jgi:cyclase
MARTVAAVTEQIFVPLAVGGGIRSVDDAAAVFDAGADKVAINTAAVDDPDLISRIAARYGSQAVVVAIDAKRSEHGFDVYTRSGRLRTDRDAVEWAREAAARGAGELLATSIDRDGTKSGFDTGLTAALSDTVSIPVIASGGAGTPGHFVEVFTAGRADAALAASIFHFEEHGIASLKRFLSSHGVPVRC